MQTKITNMSDAEKRKRYYTNALGETIMVDSSGRVWYLYGMYDTKKEIIETEEKIEKKSFKQIKLN